MMLTEKVVCIKDFMNYTKFTLIEQLNKILTVSKGDHIMQVYYVYYVCKFTLTEQLGETSNVSKDTSEL